MKTRPKLSRTVPIKFRFDNSAQRSLHYKGFMKPRVFKQLVCVCLLLVGGPVFAAVDDTPPPLGVSPSPTVDTPTPPTATASPGASVKPGKKPKPPRDPNAPPRPPKVKKAKDIPFPLPIGNSALDAIFPENSVTGALLMKLMALKVTRISNELVQMEQSNLDFKQSDGKEDFHVELPKSILNLKTNMVNSDDPVTIRTQDFELTGEKMEFNTVDRTGKLIGRVHMVIHNLKQVAGPTQPTPAP